MRSLKTPFALFIMMIVSILVGCNQDVGDRSEDLIPLQPASLDETAGTWKMLVMTSPSQVAVPAPAAVTSPTYAAELVTIKNLQSKLNDAQRKSIAYWSAGGILRWNQIIRELAAKWNLPPAPLADNSYPAPDAENPFGDPAFPFSNPPYAARAYGYITVGQFEAMKATWYYKYQATSRPAPYTVDSGVQALVPKTDLPAYPSEDAVMSGVTAEMLKNLFPAALQEITLKAAEQRNAALWSGKASPSDISAGLALGKSIATLMIARAGTDGMKNAIGSKPQWDAFADSAVKHGQIPWKSLDGPPRPPMLPFFGAVKGWNMTPANFVSERPVPPPSTSSAEMDADVKEVKYYADNLTRERIAIVHKWADGAGTYTPPGHWNDIAEEFVRDAHYSEVRAARAFALLNMAMHEAAIGCWEAKYYYFNPRPSQMDNSIRTGTGIPNFPAYPSGHSTFSGAACVVLSYLFPQQSGYFEEQSSEASMSRLYGGIHYRTDAEKGLDFGKRIGAYTVSFATTDGAD